MKLFVVLFNIILCLTVLIVITDAKETNHSDDNKNLTATDGNNRISTVSTTVSNEDGPAPVALPVISPEEAKIANKKAIKYYRNKERTKTIESFFKKIDNNNIIHCFFALLPLLLVVDILFFKKQRNKSKISEYFSLSRRIYTLLSVSLLAFGTLAFVPWSVYFGNSIQFPFIFQDFVNWNLRILTLSIVSSCIVLLLIPPAISDYLVAAIAGLGLCVYVQSMFMNQYLGTMDGVEPDWSEHRFFGTINIIIWILIFFTPMILKKMIPNSFHKIVSMSACFILALELSASASMVFSANQNVWERKDAFFIDGSQQFQLSKKKNIVVFIFDTLGSGFVEQCFESHPETKDIVKDFIWYTEARSNYHKTFPGLSHELTGSYLPAPANNYYELFDKIWHSMSAQSFYKQINDAGYDARLYCKVGKFLIGPEKNFSDYFSNIEARDITYKINYPLLHTCLKQMSGFSLVPYFFKKNYFYAFDFSDDVVQMQVGDVPSDKKQIPNDNPNFLKKMISSGITLNAKRPVLSFYYTHGVHKQWHIDEKCNRLESIFDTPIPTTRSCFYILSEFIRLLKEAKIYDNTAILVCSDHGGNDRKYSTPYDMTFMVKPFHENKKELSKDNSKIQSIDILPTLLQLACGDSADFKEFEGYTPSNIPSDRVRKVYRFGHIDNCPDPDPDLVKVYDPGCNGLEEYIFPDKDIQSFKYGINSESFVRLIPLVTTTKDN